MNTALYSSRCMRHSTIRSTRYHSSLAKESLEVIGPRINATTSLPPPLLLPPTRKENDSRVKYVYKVGKSYLAFYKAGFKQILANRNLVKEIRIRHDGDKLLKSIAGDAIDHRTGKLISVNTSGTTSQTLSRADYQLLRRHARDIKKVPVFALLLAIFGEWLPLFVVFLDPLIPGTVLLPVQVRKRRLKAAKAAVAVSTDRGLVDAVRDGLEGAGIHDRQQLVTTAKSFALLGPLSQFSPSGRILRRIRRHEEYLRTDDQLLRRDLAEQRQANIQALHEVEAELAIEERGLWRADQDHEARLKLMTEWLDSTEKQKG